MKKIYFSKKALPVKKQSEIPSQNKTNSPGSCLETKIAETATTVARPNIAFLGITIFSSFYWYYA